jgi:integrase
MILTLAFAGLRLGEMLGLAWKHVDFDAGYLRIPSATERRWRSRPHVENVAL